MDLLYILDRKEIHISRKPSRFSKGSLHSMQDFLDTFEVSIWDFLYRLNYGESNILVQMNHIVNYDMTKGYHILSPLSSIIDYDEFIQLLEIQ